MTPGVSAIGSEVRASLGLGCAPYWGQSARRAGATSFPHILFRDGGDGRNSLRQGEPVARLAKREDLSFLSPLLDHSNGHVHAGASW